ncbi:MAG: hypothetical protein HQK54_07355, partial [Oligoflexales bacterium]|nr:hypothetical protein [Oligoflexales bacterium]
MSLRFPLKASNKFSYTMFLLICIGSVQSCKNSNTGTTPDQKFIADRNTTGSTIGDLEDKIDKDGKGKEDLNQYGDWEKKPKGDYWTPVSPTADMTPRVPPNGSNINSTSNGPSVPAGNYIPAPIAMPQPLPAGGSKGPDKDMYDNEGKKPATPTIPSTSSSGFFIPNIGYIFDNNSGPKTTDNARPFTPANGGDNVPTTPFKPGNEGPSKEGDEFPGVPGGFPGTNTTGGGGGTPTGTAGGFPGVPNGNEGVKPPPSNPGTGIFNPGSWFPGVFGNNPPGGNIPPGGNPPPGGFGQDQGGVPPPNSGITPPPAMGQMDQGGGQQGGGQQWWDNLFGQQPQGGGGGGYDYYVDRGEFGWWDTPLVLDFGKSGMIKTYSYETGKTVKFDIAGDGVLRDIDWVNKDARILVLPDKDGKVTSGKQLFGSATIISKDGKTAENGFAALASYDD